MGAAGAPMADAINDPWISKKFPTLPGTVPPASIMQKMQLGMPLVPGFHGKVPSPGFLSLGQIGLMPPAVQAPEVDPDLRELCANYGIEDRLLYKLNACMSKRQQTFSDDLEELKNKLKTC